MPKRFEDRILQERKRLVVTKEEVKARIANCSHGPKVKNYLERWINVESTGELGVGVWNSCPPILERGSGARVIDADGKEYIDLFSGASANNLGICNPEVVQAIKTQAEKLMQYSDLPTIPRVELSEKLVKITPGNFPKKVIYSSTGSEIIEAAMKLVRWYTGKPFILTPYGDYHGGTTGAQALTGKGGMWVYYYPVLPADTGISYFPYAYCYRCSFDKSYPACDFFCVKYLENLFESKETPYRDPKANVSNVAAIIIEPMQSSAGYIIPPKEYLVRLKALCDTYDILLVLDEIQTGMGRTGKMWGCNHSGIAPDLMTVGKSLGGGTAISALVGKEEILDSWGPVAHLGTFSGNALACAAANKVLEIMQRDNISAKASEKGDYFLDGLKQIAKNHSLIGDANGLGLYLALEFVKNKKTKEPAGKETEFIKMECLKEGLIFEQGGYYFNRFNFIPALVITKQEINQALDILDRVITRAEKLLGHKN